MNSRNVLALFLPIILGVILGFAVSRIFYERNMSEMERLSHMSRDEMNDSGDVVYGYAFMGIGGGAILGGLVGVFIYVLIKNRESKSDDRLSITST